MFIKLQQFGNFGYILCINWSLTLDKTSEITPIIIL